MTLLRHGAKKIDLLLLKVTGLVVCRSSSKPDLHI